MTTYEIFAAMSPATAERIFSWMQEKEKPLYQATIDSLAKKRNLRPVFVQRKPRPERHTWMHEAMGRKSGEAVAAQILQIWLVGAESKLLCDFLDSLGIKHDEDGTVEDLPAEPAREDLERAIATLLEKHDAEVVSVYLRAFQALNETGWTTLDTMLAEDPRLALGAR